MSSTDERVTIEVEVNGDGAWRDSAVTHGKAQGTRVFQAVDAAADAMASQLCSFAKILSNQLEAAQIPAAYGVEISYVAKMGVDAKLIIGMLGVASEANFTVKIVKK